VALGVFSCSVRETRELGPEIDVSSEGELVCEHGAGCASACDALGSGVLVDVTADVAESVRDPSTAEVPLPVAFFVATAWPNLGAEIRADGPLADGAVAEWFASWVPSVNEILGSCGIRLDVQRAEVVAIPSDRLTVLGNEADSYSGRLGPEGPPPGEPPELERLTPEAHALLSFARRRLPSAVAAVVLVDHIDYFVSGQASSAGGLSFPPSLFRDPEDRSARHGVFISTSYGRCGELPVRPVPEVVAHELGHLFLDLPRHDPESGNLMHAVPGRELRSEQCDAWVASVRAAEK
jgi:hypothetical protein